MQCLWDIQGQIEKKAINELFHQKRKQIGVYANFNRSTSDRTFEGVRLNSQKVRDHGYRFVKFAPFDEVSPDMETNTILKSMRKGLDRIEVIRDVFGPKVNIMIDCQNPFSGGIKFWVTSFNKIHRPECSFYERGRGEYSRRPTGTDCRICGGTNPKR